MKKYDDFSIRMKSYETVTRNFLIPRSYTIIRLDGRSFSKYTKNLNKPFDLEFIKDMNLTAKYLCEEVAGTKLAYVESDEISLVLTDFDNLETQAWFGGNIQKTVSISASIATAKFNQLRFAREVGKYRGFSDRALEESVDTILTERLATFDSRIFQLPTLSEVQNYFYWRFLDCRRNSISSLAQAHFSSKELHRKGSASKIEMLENKGIFWNDLTNGLKFGRVVYKIKNGERTNWQIFDANESIKTFVGQIVPENK